MASAFTLSNTSQERPPRVPFGLMKERVLGKRYEVSLAFVPARISAALHRRFKRKRGAATILSFPLSDQNGEIIMNMEALAREAKKTGMSTRDFAGYLFIHGLLHLKGMAHGSTMEHEEARFCKMFGISHPRFA